jgi:hypothetical protein
MKKDVSSSSPKLPQPELSTSNIISVLKRNIFTVLFILILLFTIALKIYKADQSGIIFDESRTFRSYAFSVEQALTSYDRPNNHVLNSIFIYYAHKFFGSYEHFVRIPSLIAGIMYSLALAYIILKIIKTKTIQLASLALISLVPFVFDYSFLARGYTFALAAITMQIALVLWLLDHKLNFRLWWLPALLIALLNFLAFGAMLSSVLILAAFNLTFILLYSPRIFRNEPNRIKSILLNLVTVCAASALPIFLLYRKIYDQIFSHQQFASFSDRWSGWSDFIHFLYGLIVKLVLGPNDTLGTLLLFALILFIAPSLLFHIYKFCKTFKMGFRHNFNQAGEKETFLLIVTGLTIFIMFVYSVIMKNSLGYPRNHLFVVPLVLLSFTLCLDRFLLGLKKEKLKNILQGAVVGIFICLTLHNFPSPSKAIGAQSISGPLLRHLQTIDPDKTWNIAFSQKAKNHSLAFLYYQQHGYKFNWSKFTDSDLFVCLEDERPSQAVCLDWKYFRSFGCAVVINRPLTQRPITLSAELVDN